MQTVEQANSEAVRGMLIKVCDVAPSFGSFLCPVFSALSPAVLQVPHMVTVETDKMYYERKMQEHQQASLRPPIIVKHTSSTSK